MKKCLICQKEEPSAHTSDPAVDIICNDCLQILTRTTQEQIIKKYKEAIDQGQYGPAYALYMFVPRKIRRLHPLKIKQRR